MEKVSLWTRMGGWLRGVRRTDGEGDLIGDATTSSETLSATSEAGQEPDSSDVAASEHIATSLSRRGRREASLSKLQDGYDRVLDMMDKMQAHMGIQEQRTQEMTTSLAQLNRSLANQPNISQQQVELLSAIAAQLETSTVRTLQLADAIGELPRVARQQSDSLGSIQRQLEMGAETDAHLATTLQSLGRSVDRLSESSEKQSGALSDLRATGNDHQEQVSRILQRQTRQFTVLVGMTAVLAVAAIVLGTIALIR
ncbi:MAG: hypothetical protein JXQ73_09110 [Phycisphaerae bacterium]|nr:hypothetical protein [Phycisphaerae bacterium]